MSTSDSHADSHADRPVATGATTAQPHPSTTAPTTSNDPDAIRDDIERTRENLAGTVDALHAKLDVKSQAKARVARAKGQAKDQVVRAKGQAIEAKSQAKNQVVRAKAQATTASGKPRPEVLAGAVGALLLVAGLVWWRNR